MLIARFPRNHIQKKRKGQPPQIIIPRSSKNEAKKRHATVETEMVIMFMSYLIRYGCLFVSCLSGGLTPRFKIEPSPSITKKKKNLKSDTASVSDMSTKVNSNIVITDGAVETEHVHTTQQQPTQVSFSELVLRDGCIMDHLNGIDASTVELGELSSIPLISAINGINFGDLTEVKLKQLNVFIQVLSRITLPRRVLEQIPLFVDNMFNNINRIKTTIPRTVTEDTTSTICSFVSGIFEERSSRNEIFSQYILSIFGVILPHVLDILDQTREQIILLRDVCTIIVIALQCDTRNVSKAIVEQFMDKLHKIGYLVEVPDSQLQFHALEILRRMQKYIPEDTMKMTLPLHVWQQWPRLLKPDTFLEEARLILNDYNSIRTVHHSKTAVFSLKAIYSVTLSAGSNDKINLNLGWFDVGLCSIQCTVDLKNGQKHESMVFFFKNIRDAEFITDSCVLTLHFHCVSVELSNFLQTNCGIETDEKTIHNLTIKFKIDSDKSVTSFRSEFLDRCRLSPTFVPTAGSYSKQRIQSPHFALISS
jgi:hypothetical protein